MSVAAASTVASPFIPAARLVVALAAPERRVTPVYVAAEAHAQPPAGLIPGSVETSLPVHYAAPGNPAEGRLPLPSREAVLAWVAQAGIDRDAGIVVYDAANGTAAARAWWVLTWAGLPKVRILDGGLKAWRAAGDAVAETEPESAAALPALQGIGTGEIAANPQAFRLIDARSAANYAGDGVQPSHLPGAVNSPAGQWQDAEGRLLPRERRLELARGLGLLDADAPPAVAYCGSGVAAAYLIAAVQDLGIQPALYAGSWSAWSADPARLAASAAA